MKKVKITGVKQMSIYRFLVIVVSAFLLESAMVNNATAQDSTVPTTQAVKDPRLVEAELNAAIAEQEEKEAKSKQAKAEADKAALLTKLPTSKTEGVDGSITLGEETGYYAEILAYESLENGAKAISAIVKKKKPNNAIVLVDTLDFTSDAALHSLMKNELKRVINQLDTLDSNSEIALYTEASEDNEFLIIDEKDESIVAAALVALPQILGAARDVSKFFQTQLTAKNRKVTLNNTALTADLAGALLEVGLKPILPKSITSPLGSFSKNYGELHRLRNAIDSRKLIASTYAARKKSSLETEKAQLQSDIKAAETKIVELKKDKKPTKPQDEIIQVAKLKISQIDFYLAELETKRALIIGYLDAGLKAADDLTGTLTTANTEGVTPFQAVSVIDYITSHPSYNLLYAEIVSQGAEIQTTKKAFSGDIAYIGGASISFLLLNHAGEIIAAGTEKKLKSQKFKRGKPIAGMSRP